MLGKVTQENLHLILPSKISCITPWLMEDKSMKLIEAINVIYHSKLYQKLSTESTKYWHLGPADLYRELQAELS